MQEAAHWSLDLLWKAPWWREYECSRDGGKHIADYDVTYFTLLLLRRSTFSSIGPFALKTFPNTVMGVRCSQYSACMLKFACIGLMRPCVEAVICPYESLFSLYCKGPQRLRVRVALTVQGEAS